MGSGQSTVLDPEAQKRLQQAVDILQALDALLYVYPLRSGQFTASYPESEVLRQEAEDLRLKADAAAKKMRQMNQYADGCMARMFGWENYYRKQARDLQKKMTRYNIEAAYKILVATNKRNGPNLLDVHGLHPNEAIWAVDERIEHMRQGAKLKIITGSGLHSHDGTVKLQPAIENHLRGKGCKVVHDRRNPGILIVSGGRNGHRNAEEAVARNLLTLINLINVT